jgi:hypothetical protein
MAPLYRQTYPLAPEVGHPGDHEFGLYGLSQTAAGDPEEERVWLIRAFGASFGTHGPAC